jgi:hypothetical protein
MHKLLEAANFENDSLREKDLALKNELNDAKLTISLMELEKREYHTQKRLYDDMLLTVAATEKKLSTMVSLKGELQSILDKKLTECNTLKASLATATAQKAQAESILAKKEPVIERAQAKAAELSAQLMEHEQYSKHVKALLVEKKTGNVSSQNYSPSLSPNSSQRLSINTPTVTKPLKQKFSAGSVVPQFSLLRAEDLEETRRSPTDDHNPRLTVSLRRAGEIIEEHQSSRYRLSVYE